jgi:hypothetical protein
LFQSQIRTQLVSKESSSIRCDNGHVVQHPKHRNINDLPGVLLVHILSYLPVTYQQRQHSSSSSASLSYQLQCSYMCICHRWQSLLPSIPISLSIIMAPFPEPYTDTELTAVPSMIRHDIEAILRLFPRLGHLTLDIEPLLVDDILNIVLKIAAMTIISSLQSLHIGARVNGYGLVPLIEHAPLLSRYCATVHQQPSAIEAAHPYVIAPWSSKVSLRWSPPSLATITESTALLVDKNITWNGTQWRYCNHCKTMMWRRLTDHCCIICNHMTIG